MKVGTIRSFLTVAACALVISLNINANAELVYGVSDQANALISFNSQTPQTVITAHSISGLQANESIVGLDFLGTTLYALGNQSRLYTINPNTAAATLVAAFTPQLNGIDFGFNSSGTLLYIASDLGQNMTLTAAGVGTAGPNYTAGSSIAGMAVDHTSGLFYGISALSHTWMTLNPTSGLVTTIGSTGGFAYGPGLALDISTATGVAYLSATVSGQSQLFTVNKATGALTVVGNVGAPGQFTSGLEAMVVVPEPSTVALFALGGLLIGLVIRRR